MADPIPTEILKQHVDILVLILPMLVNASMQSGCCLNDLKQAWVKPLLKKPGLDLVDKNYRPFSNLQFMGKLIEGVVTKQLCKHIADHNLMESMQSAYQADHSTESALVCVKADILAFMDKQEVVCLVILDLSAAFDMVDHSILLHGMESVFGITSMALDWIQSYITGRSQRVVIGDTKSEPVPLTFGVSQGTVLRPILFTLYTCPLGEICRSHSVTYHLYADFQQLYLSFHQSSMSSSVTYLEHLEACIAVIRQWMSMNMLKLNDNKTELIVLGTSKQCAKVGKICIVIGNTRVLSVGQVHNLGFFMDNLLRNHHHVSKITSTTYLHLQNIWGICLYLDLDSAKAITKPLVFSKLGYCNTNLLGTSEFLLDKLQCIQNMACRAVAILCKFDHITPTMSSLHWFRIRECITYKTACLMHRCQHGNAPTYLKELLPKRQNIRQLRSSVSSVSQSIICKLSQTCNSSFASAGPQIWNSLPSNLHDEMDANIFKKNLKHTCLGYIMDKYFLLHSLLLISTVFYL